MHLSKFDYDLPEALIAQEPLAERSASRMLFIDRSLGEIRDRRFTGLTEYLKPGDTLVLNNTKVFPARLLGVSDTGAKVEIFLIRELVDGAWETLARPARRLPVGKKIHFSSELSGEIVEKRNGGRLAIRLDGEGDISELLDRIGRTPLPPYIKRGDGEDIDRERYQTVFARNRGAVAAPTAGLHFTPEIIARTGEMGVTVTEITLHVGYGTFEPVRVNDLSEHRVQPERFEISEETAALLNAAKKDGKRIIAVGTTTTRVLENSFNKRGKFAAESGLADLTIAPGYEFKAIDGLLTNFHLPKSSLLVLVSTFGGHELIMDAYKHAVASRYRFYSYGDCMLII